MKEFRYFTNEVCVKIALSAQWYAAFFSPCTSNSNELLVDRKQGTVVESSRSPYDYLDAKNYRMNALKLRSIPYHKQCQKTIVQTEVNHKYLLYYDEHKIGIRLYPSNTKHISTNL